MVDTYCHREVGKFSDQVFKSPNIQQVFKPQSIIQPSLHDVTQGAMPVPKSVDKIYQFVDTVTKMYQPVNTFTISNLKPERSLTEHTVDEGYSS